MKRCSRCGEQLPLDSFHRDRSRPDGRQRTCRSCKTAEAAERRFSDPERHAEEQRAWRRKNPEAVREIKRRSDSRESRRAARKATALVHWHVKHGKLMRPELCSRCMQAGPVEAHHEDYARPLDVVWLCKKCHLARHGKQPRTAEAVAA